MVAPSFWEQLGPQAIVVVLILGGVGLFLVKQAAPPAGAEVPMGRYRFSLLLPLASIVLALAVNIGGSASLGLEAAPVLSVAPISGGLAAMLRALALLQSVKRVGDPQGWRWLSDALIVLAIVAAVVAVVVASIHGVAWIGEAFWWLLVAAAPAVLATIVSRPLDPRG